MIGLFNCKGQMVGRYSTQKGLNIAIAKMKHKLWYLYEMTQEDQRKPNDLVWYSKALSIV